MGPLAVLGGVKAVGGLIQGIKGLFQGGKARKLAKQNVRPEYEIPKEIEQNLRMAKTRANQGLSTAEYGKALNNIWRNRNSAMSSAQDRRSGLAMVSTTNQLANDATTNLDVTDARERKDNERFLAGQNQVMAGYKDKQWDWNKRQKFIENADAIRALYGAGQRNLNGGLNNLMGAATTYLTGRQNQKDGLPTFYGSDYGYLGGLPRRTPVRTQQDWNDYDEDR